MKDTWHEKIKNKNREEIIEAGKELFLKDNFINVNIKDVCALAKVSRVTFYKHFNSIDELSFEVQMNILSHMMQAIIKADDCELNGKERLKTLLYAWIEYAKKHRDEMKFIILFDLYYEKYDSNEELKIRYDNFIVEDKERYFLSSAIISGINDKSLKADLDPIKIGYYIFQTIMGLLQRMSYTSLPVNSDNITFDEIAGTAIEMIIDSIKSDDN